MGKTCFSGTVRQSCVATVGKILKYHYSRHFIHSSVNFMLQKFLNSAILHFCIATIGIFGLGTVLAWTSPALPEIEEKLPFGKEPLSVETKSWIGSIAMVSLREKPA